VLLEIDSPSTDQVRLDELKTEHATLTARVDALQTHLEKLSSLRSELMAGFHRYKDSMLERISHELDEARSEAAAAEVALKQRVLEEKVEQALSRQGFGRPREFRQSQFAAEIAASNVARANAAVARLVDQRDAVERGIFTGPGDSRNDVPYSRQRIHELTVQQLDDEARIHEHRARIAQIQQRIADETGRLRQRASHRLEAPVDGVIWRHFVTAGSAVAPQTELLQIVDASRLFIEASLAEKFADEVRPGDRVVIRLGCSGVEVPGTIRHILGEAALREDRTLAAEAPKTGRNEFHAIIDFEPPSAGAGGFNRFHVGRRVEVRFPGVAGSVLGLR
jgi:multidrug resistance efflux pump